MKSTRQIFNVKDYQVELPHRVTDEKMNIIILSSNEDKTVKISEDDKEQIRQKVSGTVLEELNSWEETKKNFLY